MDHSSAPNGWSAQRWSESWIIWSFIPLLMGAAAFLFMVNQNLPLEFVNGVTLSFYLVFCAMSLLGGLGEAGSIYKNLSTDALLSYLISLAIAIILFISNTIASRIVNEETGISTGLFARTEYLLTTVIAAPFVSLIGALGEAWLNIRHGYKVYKRVILLPIFAILILLVFSWLDVGFNNRIERAASTCITMSENVKDNFLGSKESTLGIKESLFFSISM